MKNEILARQIVGVVQNEVNNTEKCIEIVTEMLGTHTNDIVINQIKMAERDNRIKELEDIAFKLTTGDDIENLLRQIDVKYLKEYQKLMQEEHGD